MRKVISRNWSMIHTSTKSLIGQNGFGISQGIGTSIVFTDNLITDN
jgi:hypothetical protein